MAESSFELISGKYKLPAVLTLPKAGKKVPVVILVHGSGPNDRDESIGPNKPFRELAHELALRGVAVVRYDKRTLVYPSSWESVAGKGTFMDETVEDALAAIDWVRGHASVDSTKVYILGHSLLPSGRVCFEERGEVRTQKKVCTCFGTADFQFSLMLFEIIQLQQFQLLL
jgi:dipeptidyl aminopeptidase/acylaminoacyl peptidase